MMPVRGLGTERTPELWGGAVGDQGGAGQTAAVTLLVLEQLSRQISSSGHSRPVCHPGQPTALGKNRKRPS